LPLIFIISRLFSFTYFLISDIFADISPLRRYCHYAIIFALISSSPLPLADIIDITLRDFHFIMPYAIDTAISHIYNIDIDY
jgi:hypothetical protein